MPNVSGGHYLADRGYSSSRGIGYLTEGGGRLAVRLNPNAVLLCKEDGSLFPMLGKLPGIKQAGQVSQWRVSVADSQGEVGAFGRLCVLRKSEEAMAGTPAQTRSGKFRGVALRKAFSGTADRETHGASQSLFPLGIRHRETGASGVDGVSSALPTIKRSGPLNRLSP